MALLDDVKDELAAIDNDSPAAKMAQASAMMRFGGGLRPVNNQAIIRAQFDSPAAASWLERTITAYFQKEAVVREAARQTPGGVVRRYDVFVERGATALALQTGLLDRRMRLVKGLPADIVSGNIAQIKAAWRGAFLARGAISDPGKASYLEIICPTHETALALQGAARRLGISARARQVRSSERVTLRDPDAIERMLIIMGASRSAREWTGKRSDGEARGKANRLANFDDANMRRSAKAAAEAGEKVRKAFEILGDDMPDNLKNAGQLRLNHPDASLEELGRLADPPITKDAIAGRIRRLLQLSDKTRKARMQND
ncbi:DNA-binding protein WhiA [Bifidobacterium mongoliense]|uniref:Probable cell division protein WhiA n=2 Tax=Bifidobacterium mongoliense TaxID=518643 RepID=A0A087C0P9_9BIFI|nr:DNA-binding protein WhiA [Bifidobacterium mongoliense]KFI76849.1 putative sporulation transcription regulator whiA [Bifidobacterium mongoliense DSM 21395]MDN5632800.1 DNA-binding protein WhiA [Bifidobacterium mongoliense]MDN5979365.1 DNA-binding protein WhiA [Bifidobacterium mongoliense]MDN6485389.1 DNA-binding protein WhiA [Bifidobacterium mongoliense]MDN6554188.1 DNA-binding protein WhiA [Bifidobacterium mongoliense]